MTTTIPLEELLQMKERLEERARAARENGNPHEEMNAQQGLRAVLWLIERYHQYRRLK